ncbi:uncharacterized protein EDB93DRAFT_1175146 [Suillus bovinus]|uniref:uncharacterized protein n=1 Tax=Suillus bovinus TaxID=48563 RepID=UPI001B878F9B|nr:uncharacterized protein EDB93DRAFT_1175146 [Suillus bovinus]KAG2133188.1 hypothetical protein EDB93DRAFT_1175146 [Suillus bovinus]
MFSNFSNSVGCLVTHRLPFHTYLATYLCIVNCSLLSQYFYLNIVFHESISPTSRSMTHHPRSSKKHNTRLRLMVQSSQHS